MCVFVRLHVCMFVQVIILCVHVFVHLCVCMCMHVCVCMCVHCVCNKSVGHKDDPSGVFVQYKLLHVVINID